MRDQILHVKEVPHVPMVLVGNKCDLADERIITTEQGEAQAKNFGARFMEASAKTKTNVENIILLQQHYLMKRKKKEEETVNYFKCKIVNIILFYTLTSLIKKFLTKLFLL